MLVYLDKGGNIFSMSFSLAQQTLVFLESILFGFFAGFIYDICKAFRVKARLKTIGIIVTDIIFWLVFIAFLFLFAVTDAVSQIRFYIILGQIGGMSVYFLSFSQLFFPLLCFFVSLILFVIYMPLKVIKIIYSKIDMFRNTFQYCANFIKKRLSFLMKWV